MHLLRKNLPEHTIKCSYHNSHAFIQKYSLYPTHLTIMYEQSSHIAFLSAILDGGRGRTHSDSSFRITPIVLKPDIAG